MSERKWWQRRRPKESAEIPLDYLVVIADDIPNKAQATDEAVKNVFTGAGDAERGTAIVRDFQDLLVRSLFGKSGGQADVVLLDHNYDYDPYGSWPSRQDVISKVAKAHHIDIPEVESLPDYLLGSADSVNFAHILRAMGYVGSIFVASSIPPYGEGISAKTSRLTSDMPGLQIRQPVIDGFTDKPGDSDFSSISYANSFNDNGSWNRQYIEGGNMTDTLRVLFQIGCIAGYIAIANIFS